jgi:hypothetical protein
VIPTGICRFAKNVWQFGDSETEVVNLEPTTISKPIACQTTQPLFT